MAEVKTKKIVKKKLKKGVQVQCIECNYKEEQQS